MTRTETLLLHVLAWMCEQYLHDTPTPFGRLDHKRVGVGERAVSLLAAYGLVEPDPDGGRWTEAGEALLDLREVRLPRHTLKPSDIRSLPTEEKEARLLKLLVDVCQQYMGYGDYLEHMFMSAGENAVEVLAAYGLTEPSDGRDCCWTEAGKALRDAD